MEVRQIEKMPKLPSRGSAGHKGDYGRVLIVGGSRRMIGALCHDTLVKLSFHGPFALCAREFCTMREGIPLFFSQNKCSKIRAKFPPDGREIWCLRAFVAPAGLVGLAAATVVAAGDGDDPGRARGIVAVRHGQGDDVVAGGLVAVGWEMSGERGAVLAAGVPASE